MTEEMNEVNETEGTIVDGDVIEGEVKTTEIATINILKSSDMITRDDVKFLQDHASNFEHRFRTRALFRSKTEMEAGVLNENEHPTPDSKYWQAIGEQNVHLTELISLDFEAKKHIADGELLLGEIEELEEELRNTPNEKTGTQKVLAAKIKKKKIEYEQNKFGSSQQLKTAQERMREVKNWEPIIQNLEPQLKYGKDDFELHHAERYFLRYKRRMEMLDQCPQEARESVISNFQAFADYGQKTGILIPSGESAPQIEDNTEKKTESVNSVSSARAVENKVNIPPGLPENVSKDVQYDSMEKLAADDPIAKNYFDRKVRKILVACPHRFKDDKNATNFFMMQTPAAFTCNISEPYGYSVPDSQNYIVQKAIDEGYDYIFFVEDDNLIPRNGLVQLIHHNADIVGGMYYRKYLPLETAGMHTDKDGFPGPVQYNLEGPGKGDIIHDTLVLPMGCTLIKVEALKKMSFPWYKAVGIDNRPALTSDTYLCQKMRDIGCDVITDCGVQVLHIDKTKGILYGHHDIINYKTNTVNEEWRDYFAI